MLIPKLFELLPKITKKQFLNDIIAGILVGIVALPLGIAFGIASGVSPEKGLITAVIGGFIVLLLRRKSCANRRTYWCIYHHYL